MNWYIVNSVAELLRSQPVASREMLQIADPVPDLGLPDGAFLHIAVNPILPRNRLQTQWGDGDWRVGPF